MKRLIKRDAVDTGIIEPETLTKKRMKYDSVNVTRELLMAIKNLLSAGVGFESIEYQLNLPSNFIKGYLLKQPEYIKFKEVIEKIKKERY